MSFYRFHNRIPVKWLISLTVVVFSAIMVIGLKPKDFRSSNNANWLMDRPGIRFEKNSIAYTDSIADLIHEQISPQRGFSVEIALKPKSLQDESFSSIFLIHGGHDRSQFLIGQWRSSLIVMNGDDYAYRKKTKRISFKSTSTVPITQLMTFTTGPEGSKIYIDGRLVRSRKNLHIEIPDGKTIRLILGNSVYGNHSWRGEIYGVALYGKVLTKRDIETHFQAFSENRRFPLTQQPPPSILFPLDKKGGTLETDYVGGMHSLHIPPKMKILSPRLFSRSQLRLLFSPSIFTDQDALLNLIGFIPLGVLLSATLIRLGGRSERHCILITLAVGFLASLFIETVQAWMPDRTSDILDLILNTAGTLIGAASCKYFTRIQTEY